jgi:hypothetical protein
VPIAESPVERDAEGSEGIRHDGLDWTRDEVGAKAAQASIRWPLRILPVPVCSCAPVIGSNAVKV